MKLLKIFVLLLIILILVLTVVGLFFKKSLLIEKESTIINSKEEIISLFEPEYLEWSNVLSEAPWQPRDSAEVFIFQNKIWLLNS